MKSDRLLRVSVLAAFVLLFLPVARSQNISDSQKQAAKNLAQEINRRHLGRIYVPDFIDASGQHNGEGAFLAAVVSGLVAKNGKGFTVVSRAEVHTFLDQAGLGDQDLLASDTLSKFAYQFAPDAVLWGTWTLSNGAMTVDFIARDTSGKELFRYVFMAKWNLNPASILPTGTSPSGRIFYFPGQDGVTLPKCTSCPNPSYPEIERPRKTAGSVELSALVTLEGKMDQIVLLKSLSPAIDSVALNALKSWRMEPSKTPAGVPVSVRVHFDFNFQPN